jgi:hypothetical protein
LELETTASNVKRHTIETHAIKLNAKRDARFAAKFQEVRVIARISTKNAMIAVKPSEISNVILNT